MPCIGKPPTRAKFRYLLFLAKINKRIKLLYKIDGFAEIQVITQRFGM
jgi:hypothetical protein